VAHRLAVVPVAVALLLSVPAAHATTGSPPVTVPDQVTLRLNEEIVVDVAANDTDADGDRVQVCRLGELPRELGSTHVHDGKVVLVADSVASAPLVITYYACDTSYLTSGTLTVQILRQPASLAMHLLTAKPYRVKIANRYTQRVFHCRWRSFGAREVEGKVTVAPGAVEVVRVGSRYLQVDCVSRDDDGAIGVGFATAPPPRPAP
jgi:Big-like domain-containing protein